MTTLTIDEIIDKDEVLKMARQVEFNVGFKWCVNFIELEAFAKLVADVATAKEREEIIDLVAFYGGSVDIENAIRARGGEA
jgi:hypothetical protein